MKVSIFLRRILSRRALISSASMVAGASASTCAALSPVASRCSLIYFFLLAANVFAIALLTSPELRVRSAAMAKNFSVITGSPFSPTLIPYLETNAGSVGVRELEDTTVASRESLSFSRRGESPLLACFRSIKLFSSWFTYSARSSRVSAYKPRLRLPRDATALLISFSRLS